MQWKQPKNTDKYQWTQHVSEKMHFYGLSEQKVLNVIRNPKRIETGIVENTVAVMMPVGNIGKKDSKPSKWKINFSDGENDDKWNQEIWVMYQVKTNHLQQTTDDNKKELVKNIENLEKAKAKKLMKLMPKKLIIISAWRYPGVSPKNNPIPEEILREIEETL